MPVDLHLHSIYSDGSDTPAELVANAADVGLTGIALTDHDTLEGIPEAQEAARSAGLRFAPGVELSVLWRDQTMHMLVYFLDPGPGPLQDRLGQLQQTRQDRNAAIAVKLRSLGMDVTIDEVIAEAGAGVVGRPHFAGVMMAKGYVATVAEAFERYLAAGRPGYAPRQRLTAADAIELSRSSGAVPVIAHPHTLNLRADEFASGFAELVDLGLGGIEAYYAEYPLEMRLHLARIADRLGLAATGGSDYHGTYKPGLSVGTGLGDLVVPDSALQDQEAARSDPSSNPPPRR